MKIHCGILECSLGITPLFVRSLRRHYRFIFNLMVNDDRLNSTFTLNHFFYFYFHLPVVAVMGGKTSMMSVANLINILRS